MEMKRKLRDRLYMLCMDMHLEAFQENLLLKFFEENFESLGYQYELSHELLHRSKADVPEIKAHYKKVCGNEMGKFLLDIAEETSFHQQGNERTQFEVIVYKGKK